MKKLFCFTLLTAVAATLLMLSASAADTNSYCTPFACFSGPTVNDDTYIPSAYTSDGLYLQCDAYFSEDNRTFYIYCTDDSCKIIGGECRSYENYAVMEMEGDALKITLDKNTPDFWYGAFVVAYIDTVPEPGMYMSGGDFPFPIAFHKMYKGLNYADYWGWYDSETGKWQDDDPYSIYYQRNLDVQGVVDFVGNFYYCDGSGYSLVKDGLTWDENRINLYTLDAKRGLYRMSILQPGTSVITYQGSDLEINVAGPTLAFNNSPVFTDFDFDNEISLNPGTRTFYCHWDILPGMSYSLVPQEPAMFDVIMHEGYAEIVLKPEYNGPDTIFAFFDLKWSDGISDFSETRCAKIHFPGLDRFVCDAEQSPVFTDVAEDAWYAENVHSATAYGLMIGTGNDMFKPTSNITIAELITLACRMNNIYNDIDYSFYKADVWYQPYVEYAIKYGIIEQGQYQDYTKVATRSDFITILAKALPEREFGAINDVSIEQIPDVGEDSALADEILMFYRSGVLTGTDARGTFNPDGSITRAEVAAIITRVIDPALRKNVSLSD